MIAAEIERCAGIDVGKQRLAVCIMVGPLAGEPRVEYREFGTVNAELEQLRQWLEAEGVTHVVMESTGPYWQPVFNVLEDKVKVYLAKPADVKNRKGHKTDKQDSWWLAHLLRHSMIRPSFVPPRGLRELRDLTRRRRKMIGVASSERNRVDKILQHANVKLSNALSDIFGVSGQLMLEALLEGKAPPEQIAEFAQRSARRKIPEIIAALEGHRMNEHHRRMIRYSLEHWRFLEEHILELDAQIVAKIEALGYTSQWQLLQTVPAIQANTAATVLAEIGPDMGQFEDPKHLSSWAGVVGALLSSAEDRNTVSGARLGGAERKAKTEAYLSSYAPSGQAGNSGAFAGFGWRSGQAQTERWEGVGGKEGEGKREDNAGICVDCRIYFSEDANWGEWRGKEMGPVAAVPDAARKGGGSAEALTPQFALGNQA